ncbi:MAG: hypothetical protein H8D54_01700 [Candidatus Omnitrophica bacterium]|nr:hypothetical protein [Candidatus Omnitrophota bacterium]
MIRKIFSISVVLMLLFVFSMTDTGYAIKSIDTLGKDQINPETDAAADTRTSKKSVLHGVDTLIGQGKFAQGAEFTFGEFKEWRSAYGKEQSKDAKWSVSDGMLHREISSLIMLGVLEQAGATYRVVASMGSEQMNEIDQRFQKEIEPLSRSDSERKEQSIGLNSYDLVSVTNEGQQIAMRQIVAQVLKGAEASVTDSSVKPNVIANVTNDRVFVTTTNLVTTFPTERDTVMQAAKDGYIIAIATSSDEIAVLEDAINSFGDNAPAVRKMIESDTIIFSLITSGGNVWSAIEKRAGEIVEERTADTLSVDQISELASGV